MIYYSILKKIIWPNGIKKDYNAFNR